ncbi:DUF1613-domain-containing protein [Calocera viscosa TUFC12733]|uniref:tRNA (uracil-O(2)-)-methyltransferase n=1 Tax=Calocera viscosa (strain TUFC12733) TaxID=1330018 RepID=A0A167PBE9_CALVF|nr:DUF1613-domain-containing protein [Calocera viscosa TUFC12733]
MSQPTQRPKFHPTPLPATSSILRSSLPWLPVLSAPAPFPCASFSPTLTALLQHPEHSGPLILRANPLPPPVPPIPASTEHFPGWRPVEITRRRLMPRVPERDGELVQTCVRYRPSEPGREGEMLVLIPELAEGERPPYYHPDVERLALVYTAHASPHPASEEEPEEHGTLRIEVVLPPSAPSAINPSSRLYRTTLHLLETAHKHSWGHYACYKKRVRHDILVPREAYQDLYLRLKARHKHHVASWALGTDPRKHVFEDVAIAAFLMLLWKGEYPGLEEGRPPATDDDAGECEWSTWGRPEGGFVDLGCGNGLLVHILLQEGYSGYGVDLTARKTWSTYPSSTQQHLHTSAITPLSIPPVSPPIPTGAFLIGNHPDELTPYVPLLATLSRASGWLAIPCCPFTFTGRFTSQVYKSKLGASEVERRMDEGGEGGGRVRAYLVYLEEVGRRLGWDVGVEALRMPSTRNWGLVGRRRALSPTAESERGDEEVLEEGMGGLSLNGTSAATPHGTRVNGADSEKPVTITREDGLRWAEDKLEEIRRSGGFTVREGKGHH